MEWKKFNGMITVGLVKELYFIAHFLGTVVETTLCVSTENGPSYPVRIYVSPDTALVDVWYKEEHIWSEHIEGATSFFGIESCDTISRIIACINNGSDWSQYRWKENP